MNQQPSPMDQLLESLIPFLTTLLKTHQAYLYRSMRKQNVVFCRWVVWKLMWDNYDISLREAGQIFGKYDHTTVLHGIQQMELAIERNNQLGKIYHAAIVKFNLSNKRKIFVSEEIPQPKGQKPLSQRHLNKKLREWRQLKLSVK